MRSEPAIQAAKAAAPKLKATNRASHRPEPPATPLMRTRPPTRLLAPHIPFTTRFESRPVSGVRNRRPVAAVARCARLFAHSAPAANAPALVLVTMEPLPLHAARRNCTENVLLIL